QHTAMSRMSELGELIKFLEARAGLDRSLEYLPTVDELADRISKDSGLTRPELAVLTSYMKMYLKSELARSDFIDDEYLTPYLYSAFPPILVSEYGSKVLEHRLRREITATQLANNIVNLVGPSFVYRKIEYTGASPGDVIKAAVIAKDLFAIDEKLEAIEALDYQISADVQRIMIQRLMQLMRRVTRWILRNRRGQLHLGATVAEFSAVIRQTESLLLAALPAGIRDRFEKTRSEYIKNRVPESLASRIAAVDFIYPTLAIVEICKITAVSPKTALQVYFALGDQLQITAIRQSINDLGVSNSWQALARKSFQDDLDWQQRALTQNVIVSMGGRKNIKAAVASWCDSHAEQVARTQQIINSIQLGDKSDYAMFSVVLRELLNLAQSTTSYYD
ncbi:MAG: NAD-glutamate dehydrogenase, partial [Gammaproteobacteria bacterium]|nr:NAD-glutamate dehydrogenase [Gammaproteobacteria bacterium]